MKLDLAAAETLRALRRANGASFGELVKIAGLNPARDFRDADLSGVDFAGSNLDGYDFSGAKLSNASFVGAYNYDHAVFERAEIDGVTWPGGWRPNQGGRLPLFSEQGELDYSQDGDHHNRYVGGDEDPTSPEEAELVLRLNNMEEELRRVRGAIAQLTQDDLNTSLSLPWNKAAYTLRTRESTLSKAISEVRQKLGGLPRLERRGAY